MEKNIVECPKCGESFSLAEVVTNELEQKLKERVEKQMVRRENDLKTREKTLEAVCMLIGMG